MDADLLVEPFVLKLGFREIDFFNCLNTNLQAFLTAIADEPLEGQIDPETDLDRLLQKEKEIEMQRLEEKAYANTGDRF